LIKANRICLLSGQALIWYSIHLRQGLCLNPFQIQSPLGLTNIGFALTYCYSPQIIQLEETIMLEFKLAYNKPSN